MKEMRRLRAFGKIGNELTSAGFSVFVAEVDGFGSIETNAGQLREYILRVLAETGAEKVNIIGHSKGGLDSKYMITSLEMEDYVASLTTLCTPHRGSIIASKIWSLPLPLKRAIAKTIDLFYKKICHDEYPDSMRACEQLRHSDTEGETIMFSEKVYCQSYSAGISKVKDCFIMALPMKLQHRYQIAENDGLVTDESSKFGTYRGRCLDIPVSHVQIIDFFSKKHQKEKIYSFYIQICKELSDMGF